MPARSSAESVPVSTPASPTTRRLVAASVSPNTRETYVRALRQVDAWRDGHPITDTRLAGHPNPAGEHTARVLAGFRRTATGRSRGQAPAFTADDLAVVLRHMPPPQDFRPWQRVP